MTFKASLSLTKRVWLERCFPDQLPGDRFILVQNTIKTPIATLPINLDLSLIQIGWEVKAKVIRGHKLITRFFLIQT